MSPLSILEVNNLDGAKFRSLFGNVIELCEEAAIFVEKGRPFVSVEQLCDKFHEYLDGISEEEKLLILKLHPDLAGRLAARGELTKESAAEQRSAGLNSLTEDQRTAINEYNQRYKDKFGFPFIICARENKVQSILKGLQDRYNNDKSQEILTGINEVKKICKLRILDLVHN